MIAVTPAAHDRLSSILAAQISATSLVRVSAVRGPHGCIHGWSLGIDDRPAIDDVVQTLDGLQLVTDSSLTNTLDGATIDYREDGTAIGFTIQTATGESGHGHGECHHH